MERTLNEALPTRVGDRVRIQGWLHHQRQLSQITFALVRDRSGITQVVLTDERARARNR